MTEIELLAVVWAVNKCRLFFIGADVEVIVDHRPLLSILNSKTLDELTSPRIVRLREKLTPYRFSAIWRPGIEHRMADCLSQSPVADPDEDDLLGESDIEQCYHICQQVAGLDVDTGETILPDRHI